MTPFEFDNLEKLFYEENTNRYYPTLGWAKTAHKNARVYRIWKSNKIQKKHLIYASGERICTVKLADQIIENEINSAEEKYQLKLF